MLPAPVGYSEVVGDVLDVAHRVRSDGSLGSRVCSKRVLLASPDLRGIHVLLEGPVGKGHQIKVSALLGARGRSDTGEDGSGEEEEGNSQVGLHYLENADDCATARIRFSGNAGTSEPREQPSDCG